MSATDEVLPTACDLTSFQLSLLASVAASEKSGQEIKEDLEPAYDTEINNGRLYPNLDALEREGLIEKSPRDRRTNDYRITQQGRNVITIRQQWLAHKISGGRA